MSACPGRYATGARGLLLALLVMLAIAPAAHAHRMVTFATAEGDTVSGYGFFAGGGRAVNAPVTAITTDGVVVFEGQTGPDGTFSFTVPPAHPVAGLIVRIDSGDGHQSEAVLSAGRAAVEPAPPPDPGSGSGSAAPAGATGATTTTCSVTPAAMQTAVETAVDAAVARQVRPLLEAYVAAEARARWTDVAAGLGMILGLVGIGMWALACRRAGSGAGRVP